MTPGIAADSVSKLAKGLGQKAISSHFQADLACMPLGATSECHLPPTEVVVRTVRQSRPKELKLMPSERQWLR